MLHTPIRQKTLDVLVATPGGGTGQGGIDRVMAGLAGELAKQARTDVRLKMLATRGGGHIAMSPAVLALFCARMIELKARDRVDLVHINLASNGSTYRKMFVARMARTLGIPYVLHLHGGEYGEFWARASPWMRRRITNMFEGAARIIVLGKVWADFVGALFPNTVARIVVAPNGTPAPTLPHVGGDKVHILFLGKIMDAKGVPELGAALKRMEALPGWRATIAGNGNVEAARAKAAELGLEDRVDIPGWVDAAGVAELIAHADVLVLPSHVENLPLSVIEGMGAGLAVVATPVGAVEEIVTDGETGLLVPVRDVDALTTALTRLVEDKALRTRLGAAAQAVHRQRLEITPYTNTIVDIWRSATVAPSQR